jgi:hypothetical protein
MYADLFLALMVIFLATISFVPALVHIPHKVTSVTQKAKTKTDYFKAFSRTYDKFDLTQINSDISQFATEQGLPGSAAVVYGHFIGGFNPTVETASDGTFRALIFSQKLTSDTTGVFTKMQSNINASTELKPSQVAIVLTFGPLGGN